MDSLGEGTTDWWQSICRCNTGSAVSLPARLLPLRIPARLSDDVPLFRSAAAGEGGVSERGRSHVSLRAPRLRRAGAHLGYPSSLYRTNRIAVCGVAVLPISLPLAMLGGFRTLALGQQFPCVLAVVMIIRRSGSTQRSHALAGKSCLPPSILGNQVQRRRTSSTSWSTVAEMPSLHRCAAA